MEPKKVGKKCHKCGKDLTTADLWIFNSCLKCESRSEAAMAGAQTRIELGYRPFVNDYSESEE